MAQNLNLGLLGQFLTVNSASNTAIFANAITVGNSTVNVTINSTSFSGTSVAAIPSYVVNTSAAFTIAGNTTFSGNTNHTGTNNVFGTMITVGAVPGAAGNSVSANVTTILIGNATVYSTVNSSVYSGSANNATYLGGTINTDYALKTYVTSQGYISSIPAYVVNTSAAFTLAGNISISGNTNHTGTNNVFGSMLTVGAAPGAVGSSVSANVTTILIGNSTVNATVNSSVYSGTANNALYLGGTLASSYVTGTPWTSQGYLTAISGSGNVAYDSSRLGGTVAASYALLAGPTFTGTVTTGNVVTIGTAAYHVSNGNFGIANTTPADKLAVAGTSYFNGNVVFNGVASFYNINAQENAVAGDFVANAYATLGGYAGAYLAFGQQTSSAQWIQSGYSSAGAPVYYHIILNPLGGNIGIGNTTPADRLSVNGTTYLQGNVSVVTGNTTLVNVYSTGTVNAAALTIGTIFTVNTSQANISGIPLSANSSNGSQGHILYSNGNIGSPYWAAAPAGGVGGGLSATDQIAWTNTQSFSNSITFNGAIISTNTFSANSSVGAAGQVLTSGGAGANVYWSTIVGGSGSSTTNATTELFTGDNIATSFTLTNTVTNKNNIIVTVNGLTQIPSTNYTIVGSQLVFTTAPYMGAIIEVRNFETVTIATTTPSSSSVNISDTFVSVFLLGL